MIPFSINLHIDDEFITIIGGQLKDYACSTFIHGIGRSIILKPKFKDSTCRIDQGDITGFHELNSFINEG